MTVQELIDELLKYPSNLRENTDVYAFNCDGEHHPVNAIDIWESYGFLYIEGN